MTNRISELHIGKVYIFSMSDGSKKRVTIFGQKDAALDIEVDGVRSTFSSLADALGGSYSEFSEDPA